MSAASRRARVAASLARSEADVLVATSPAAIAYLADVDVRGYGAAASAVLAPDGDIALVVSAPDAPSDAPDDVRIATWAPGPDAAVERAARLGESLSGARRGLVETGRDPARLAAVAQTAPDVSWEAGDAVLDAAWATRDDDELRRLRAAANLADIGYTAVVDRLTPDLRVLELVRNVDRSLRSAGGGGFWSPHEDDAGLTADVHYPRSDILALLGRRPETGVLERAAPLPFALYPLSEGYAGAAGTTAVLSPPSAELRSRAELLSDAVQAAIDAIRPGASAGDVHAAFASVARRASEEAASQTVGYGIGTGIARPLLVAGSRDEIAPSTAVSVRASLAGDDGEPPVAYQTTVLVTASGAEVLNIVPLRLIELC